MKYIIPVLAICIVFASCAGQAYNEFGNDIKRIEIQTRENAETLQDIKSRMSQLPDSTYKLLEQADELYAAINDLKDNLKRISEDVDNLTIKLKAIEGRTDTMAYNAPAKPVVEANDENNVTDDQGVSIIGSNSGTLPPREERPDILELQKRYSSAYSDYIASIYSIAIIGFESFIKDAKGIPELEYMVVNSYFWLGDCYYIKKDYNKASYYMETYVSEAGRTRPKDNLLPDAYFRSVQIYNELGMVKEARNYLERLNREFPMHKKTKEANELDL